MVDPRNELECKMLFHGLPHLCMDMDPHTHSFPSLPLNHSAGVAELHVDTFSRLLLKASAKAGTEESVETAHNLAQADLCQQKWLLCRVPGSFSSPESPKGQLRHSLT